MKFWLLIVIFHHKIYPPIKKPIDSPLIDDKKNFLNINFGLYFTYYEILAINFDDRYIAKNKCCNGCLCLHVRHVVNF